MSSHDEQKDDLPAISPCSCNIVNPRVWTLPQGGIPEEDHFSALPDDCIVEIFDSCDHDVLDVLATVNQRVNTLVNVARVKTKKKRQSVLRIEQDKYILRVTPGFECKEYECYHQSTKCQFFHNIQFLLSRYRFETIEVVSCNLDSSFIDHLAPLLTSTTATTAEFREVSFTKEPGNGSQGFLNGSRTELTDCILAMRPVNTAIQSVEPGRIINVPFLEKLALLNDNPNFELSTGHFDEATTISVPVNDWVHRFDNLIAQQLVFNVDEVMTVIKARLRRNSCGGIWLISTNVRLDEKKIEESLDADMQYEEKAAREHVIRLNGGGAARIKHRPTKDFDVTISIDFRSDTVEQFTFPALRLPLCLDPSHSDHEHNRIWAAPRGVYDDSSDSESLHSHDFGDSDVRSLHPSDSDSDGDGFFYPRNHNAAVHQA